MRTKSGSSKDATLSANYYLCATVTLDMVNEGAYYNHDEYGRIRVVGVTDGSVLFKDTRGQSTVEPRPTFDDQTDPADTVVGVSAESIGLNE